MQLRSRTPILAALSVLPLDACQPAYDASASSVPATQNAPASDASLVAAGYTMSEALCSGCHAIEINAISPNPESPTFESIANTDGLTRVTLKDWLLDSHNYPGNMNFEVPDENAERIAAYIYTLRSE